MGSASRAPCSESVVADCVILKQGDVVPCVLAFLWAGSSEWFHGVSIDVKSSSLSQEDESICIMYAIGGGGGSGQEARGLKEENICCLLLIVSGDGFRADAKSFMIT